MKLRGTSDGRHDRDRMIRHRSRVDAVSGRPRQARAALAIASVFALTLMGAVPALAAGGDAPDAEALAQFSAEADAPTEQEPPPPPVEESAPPAAEPPAAEPPAAEPPATQPPATEPPAAEPPAAEAPAPAAPPKSSDAPAEQSPDAQAPAAQPPEPPYLRWQILDESGERVAGAQLEVQGPTGDSTVAGIAAAGSTAGIAAADNVDLWLNTATSFVRDNIGAPDYVGPDLDPTPGLITVKELPRHLQPGSTHSVAENDVFRVRAVEADGFQVGDLATWVLAESLNHEVSIGDVPKLVLTPVTAAPGESDEPDAQPEASRADVGVLAVGGPEPSVLPPYLYWNLEQSNGDALGGATFRIAPGIGNNNNNWGPNVSVPDCVAASAADCVGPDLDPNPGEFQVKHLGTATSTPVVAGNRYRVSQTLTPPGFEVDITRGTGWQSLAVNQPWNDGNGPQTHDFGTWTNWNTLAPGTSRIVVHVGGDRNGASLVQGLQGVVLHLRVNNNGSAGARADGQQPNYAGANAWARCVSDVEGRCAFVVPNTGNNQSNRDRRFWVVQYSVPSGWYANPTLRTGDASGSSQATPYEFLTGTLLRSPNTYESGDNFMLGGGSETRTSSGGVWQQSRVNPTFPQACGVDVALVLDLSGSVGSALPALKTAANTFTDSLSGTQSRMALFSFAQNSPAGGATNYPELVSVATPQQAAAFKARYTDWDTGGATNWDRGLAVPANTNSGANRYQVVVVITDGNPTVSGSRNSPIYNRLMEVEHGIFSANLLKSQGSRVIAFGVGTGVTGATNGLNLRAISGTTAYTGANALSADYYQTSDYEAVGDQLRELALGNCGNTLTVTKMVVPDTAPPGSITGAAPGVAGWKFTASNPGAGLAVPDNVQTTVADGTGTVTFPLEFSHGTPSASLTIAEQQQPGYQLVQPAPGKNAVCTNLRTQASVPITGNVADGFTVNALSADPINCVMYNRVPSQASQVTVSKVWNVDGHTYRIPGDVGTLPLGLRSQLTLTGPGSSNPGGSTQAWGAVRANYTAGSGVTINEVPFEGTPGFIDPSILPGCTLDAQQVTSSKLGNTAEVTHPNVDLGQTGYTVPSLGAGSNEFEITNTVTCTQTLELVKAVSFGSAGPDEWVLTGTPAVPDALPGPSGRYEGPATVTAQVTAGAPYLLEESEGPATYVATEAGWTCQTAQTSVNVEVVDGAVEVPIGQHVRCTIRNTTGQLTVFKNVEGSAEPGAWKITGVPDQDGAPVLADAVWPGASSPASGAPSGGTTVEVRPGHTYVLSEAMTDEHAQLAYLLTKVQRWDPQAGDDGAWVDVAAADLNAIDVAVAPGTHEFYRFVNVAAPAVAVPLTGGVSGDFFGYAGAGIVIFAALMALFTLRRYRWQPAAK